MNVFPGRSFPLGATPVAGGVNSSIFSSQDPAEVIRLDGWALDVGRHGHRIGMETFGASAPLREPQKKFGFVPENVVSAAKAQITRARR